MMVISTQKQPHKFVESYYREELNQIGIGNIHDPEIIIWRSSCYIAKLLISNGHDINLQDNVWSAFILLHELKYGKSSIHYAASGGNYFLIPILI
jgi:hypothetical protein